MYHRGDIYHINNLVCAIHPKIYNSEHETEYKTQINNGSNPENY